MNSRHETHITDPKVSCLHVNCPLVWSPEHRYLLPFEMTCLASNIFQKYEGLLQANDMGHSRGEHSTEWQLGALQNNITHSNVQSISNNSRQQGRRLT